MAQGGRRSNPLFAILAFGLFAFGLLAIYSSIQNRLQANRIPTGAEELWQTGYVNLMPSELVPTRTQMVAVLIGKVNAGEAIPREMVELRPAQAVVDKYPSFEIAGARDDPTKDLVEGFYESLPDVDGKYALLDLNPDTPLLKNMLSARNPNLNSLDEQRYDRLTVPVADGASIYDLLVPGDRVDVFLVADEDTIWRAVPNVRVIAVNNVVTKGSGIFTPEEETKLSYAAEAAQRRKLELEDEARRRAATQPQQTKDQTKDAKKDDKPASSDDEDAGSTNAKGGPQKKVNTGGVDPKKLPKSALRAGRTFHGRTLTLQVSREEALTLAMAHSASSVRFEFAVHHRR